MEIPQKLLKLKLHILVTALTLVACSTLTLLYVAPRFLDIVKYFWPLLVSTGMFLVAISVLGLISPPSVDAPAEKAGEGLLEYVAGQPCTGELQSIVEEEEETVGAK